MARFIIHVGPHKTGTTYLQLSCRALASELAARGTVFPDFWAHAPGNPSMKHLARKLAERDIASLVPQFAGLVDAGHRRILLSSEALCDLDDGGLRCLRTLTEGHEVQLVFYVRRWSELLPSSWRESAKHGQLYTFPELAARHLFVPEESRLVNFGLRLSRFRAIFGADSLCVVSYSELRDREIDIFQHFAEKFLNWPDAPALPRFQHSNVSRGPEEVELVRSLHAMAQARALPRADLLRRAFERLKEKRLRPLLAAMERHTQSLTLSDESPPLRLLHEALAAAYGPHLLGPVPPTLLFTPATAAIRYISGDYLAEQGASASLRTLYERVVEEMNVMQGERVE
jgi:hypothetical protein